MRKNRAIVVGAGPAGLTAAWELVRAGHQVTVLEKDRHYVGGLARTMSYRGCRFDIGAHRFFSKNPEIVRWWHERLPGEFIRIQRKTRIHYRGRYFDYPLRAGNALAGLGVGNSVACLISYCWRRGFPLQAEDTFANWVRNRFGDRLYNIFFKTYTEKVWGMLCSEISADWARQRIKGLSLTEAIGHAFRKNQPTLIKTLVNEFEYPRYGPGQLWEKVRNEIVYQGGQVLLDRKISRFRRTDDQVEAVITDSEAQGVETYEGDAFIVSMSLSDCVAAISPSLGTRAESAGKALRYRDHLTVVLLIRRLGLFPDQWLYIHDPGVKVARIVNYNNWGTEMVQNSGVTCLALEYFCSRENELWTKDDDELLKLARQELGWLGLAGGDEVIDGCVVRADRAYPIYDQAYSKNVEVIRNSLSPLTNLQVVGRNGMHKYNNQDHSMLTGMLAARNLQGAQFDVWQVNTDAEYHESGISEDTGRLVPRAI